MDLGEYVADKIRIYGKSTGMNKEPSYGFGINDAEYITQSKHQGWHCPHFRKWQGVMQRSYCPKYKERRPTYSQCFTDERWKYFSRFLEWSLKNYVKGWELDKDILVKDNKAYGPDTCAFVPHYLNNLIKPKTSKTGLPFGVSYKTGRENSFIIGGPNKKAIGGFKTADAAHRAWQAVKIEQIGTTLNRYSKEPMGFRTDVAEAINKKMWDLMLDHALERETFDL